MKRSTFLKQACLIGGGAMVWVPRVEGHIVSVGHHHHHDHWILPHVRPMPRPRPLPTPAVTVERIEAGVRIDDQMARTTLTVALHNPAGQQQEGQILLPVPHGAILKSFRLEGQNGSFQAEILPREEARRIYDGIVAQMKDPAILEFAGFGALKSSVFPVPARSTVRLRMEYEELLPVDGLLASTASSGVWPGRFTPSSATGIQLPFKKNRPAIRAPSLRRRTSTLIRWSNALFGP
jgi:hypothetical protein